MDTSRIGHKKPWQGKTEFPSLLDALAEQEDRVAARLKKLRADIGHPTRPGQPLPVDDAASKAGVKGRQWQRWEKAEVMPHRKNLEKITSTYEIDLAEFFAGHAPEQAVPAPDDPLERIDQRLDELTAIISKLVGERTLVAARKDIRRERTSAASDRHSKEA